MKCENCNTEHEGEFCPNCNGLTDTPQNNATIKKTGKLLGFRTNKIWKKIVSILYLIFCFIYLLGVIGTEKYVNITNHDFIISQICDSLIFVIMITPYIFLSNTKFRNILPLFKKHSIGASTIGLIIVTIIIGVISGIIDTSHSEEFLNDRENHAYTETVTEATCEKAGEIKKFCEYCGISETETIAALGHKMTEITRKEATETTEGEIVEECSVCGKQKKTVLEKIKTNSSTAVDSSSHSEASSKTEIKSEENNIDISKYYGKYYSKSKLYEISLQENDGKSFYISLVYTDGTIDDGYVTPNKQTTLNNYSQVVITLKKNGVVHIKLNSAISANGNFDEDLIKGSLLEAVGLISASLLNDMDYSERFPYLCQIEENCLNLSAKSLIQHPNQYCNDTIYRMPGVVTWAEGNKFLLQITEKQKNDTIICYSQTPVTEGEKICVYGNGIGKGTYTKGSKKYETLELQVGYILYPNKNIPYEGALPGYIQNFINGDYTLKNAYSSPYNLESTLSVKDSVINSRSYTIEKATLTFSYTPDFDNLNGLVAVQLLVSTGNKRNQPVQLSLLFDVDSKECHCVVLKEEAINTEYIFYERVN